MEAKRDSARKSRLGPRASASASASPAAKVFSLKQKPEEVRNAPRLVGRIVEKGFSPDSDSSSLAPSTLPQPTVLPFPVARHRSQGPHWSPMIPDQELFEEEMDLDTNETDYDPVAAFAQPIQRKEKKELNFSQWRDFISNNDSNPPKIKKKVVKPSTKTTEREIKEINGPLIKDVPMHDAQEETSQNLRSISLGEEIDLENAARLSQMSAEEIAEAQREIMEKMDPALVKMLQKRGKNKSEKRSGFDTEKIGEVKQKDAGATPGDWLKQSQERVGSDVLWRDWSDRVERVRLYRFNLNGDVLGIDSSVKQNDGSKPQLGHYHPDSVAERDFLRTEGDPASIGYTINEAVSLTRSVVPGQRALALQLLSSILNNSLHNLQKEGDVSEIGVDWQAVWAFSLGPEPQLALSLRMALDDNHESVVLACARAIQSVLSCDMNENYFDISEKLPVHERHICTAPVFRSRPDLKQGFLQGGFWKYNTKPSSLLPDFHENENENDSEDGSSTIKDDMVVAGQDVAAGLIRMSILPRICYILEMEPHLNLEDTLISILVALARHSPQSSNAILRCPRLIQAVAKVLTNQQMAEISSSQIKALTLVKILSKYSKKTCFEFINQGIFQLALWNWFKGDFTLDNWIRIRRENLKLSSSMLVKQLRLWRVYINHGLCISHFIDFFPVLCLFLTPPILVKLVNENALEEFASVTAEAYLVLHDLSLTLPVMHSSGTGEDKVEKDTWKWSHAIPMVDLAIKWLELKNIPYFLPAISQDEEMNMAHGCPLLWVFSSILHMLNGILQKIAPVDKTDKRHELQWLPDFVPRLGLAVINGFLKQNKGALLKELSDMRKFHKDGNIRSSEVILASTSCIRGLVKVASFIDILVQRAKNACTEPQVGVGSMTGGEILEAGIVNWASHDLSEVFSMISLDISSEWHAVQCVEVFGRAGPAPGIGFGWGSKGGGFWSCKSVLGRLDSWLVMDFIEIFPILFPNIDLGINVAPDTGILRTFNSLLEVCLMVGPGDGTVLENAIHMMFQTPVLKYLVFCVNYYISKIVSPMATTLYFSEDEFSLFSEELVSHFKTRWLDVKKKLKKDVTQQPNNSLETIHEEVELMEKTDRDTLHDLMVTEWAHQRLPIPTHWFLSPLCGCSGLKSGLVLLLALETLSHIADFQSPVSGVALVWKLHSLSMCLSSEMDVLGEEKSRAVFEIIQEIYSQELQELEIQSLDFQRQIHENYSTFVEHFIEQFAAVSYGDVLYGRQVAIYLHRMVEASVRLNAWNVLASACVLELLPPLESCIGGAHGYLGPAEDNEGILEAYAKSWISGGLDRAANRKSVAFTIAVHHLSSFLFNRGTDEKQVLQNKLMKSLLRYYCQKRQSEGMLKSLIENALDVSQELYRDEILRRFEVMKACCEGNSSLLGEVEKLRLSTSQ